MTILHKNVRAGIKGQRVVPHIGCGKLGLGIEWPSESSAAASLSSHWISDSGQATRSPRRRSFRRCFIPYFVARVKTIATRGKPALSYRREDLNVSRIQSTLQGSNRRYSHAIVQGGQEMEHIFRRFRDTQNGAAFQSFRR